MNNPPMKDVANKEEWAQMLGDHLVSELFRLVSGHVGNDWELFKKTIAAAQQSFMGTTMLTIFRDRPDFVKTNKEQMQYTEKQYLDMKVRMQEAVSEGLSDAWEAFAGKRIDYWCEFKPLQEPKNGKKPA